MFELSELEAAFSSDVCQADMAWVRQSLVQARLQEELCLTNERASRLIHLVEAVLASASELTGRPAGRELLLRAAEVAELVAATIASSQRSENLRFRSSVLYDLGERPSIARAVLRRGDVPGAITALLQRQGPYGSLAEEPVGQAIPGRFEPMRAAWVAAENDALMLASSQHSVDMPAGNLGETMRDGGPGQSLLPHFGALAGYLHLGLSATECAGLDTLLRQRRGRSTLSVLPERLAEDLRAGGFPPELWAGQIEAIKGGLIDKTLDAWGFAAPTGTGKTFLARVLLLDALRSDPDDAKALYLVPSRALVHEVSHSLGQFFSPLDIRVLGVGPQIMPLASAEARQIADADIVVITPEKADLLLRLGSGFLDSVRLLVVDEAHHIEAGSRGILLELYLWRIRKMLSSPPRTVFLSAVAPNIGELAEWASPNSRFVSLRQRATRMRVGVFRPVKQGGQLIGRIDYTDNTYVDLVKRGLPKTKAGQLVHLAKALEHAGPVLVVTKGKKECEKLADARVELEEACGATPYPELPDCLKRLDSRLEREMHKDVAMRRCLRWGIAYHHAGLPPRVRVAVEDGVRLGAIRTVFATTTLAEGVNFPFSSVIVQSLALRDPPEKGRPATYHPITVRSFWNIAGRAGRPGSDREGQAILFEPSLGLGHIGAVLDRYLDPDPSSIEPVASALGKGLAEIAAGVSSGQISERALDRVVLSEDLPRSVQGTLNLLRVAVVHARAVGFVGGTEEILGGTFAARGMDSGLLAFSLGLLKRQAAIVERFLESPGAPSVQNVAEIGLSLETLSEFRSYIANMEDWQIEQMSRVMYGGDANLSALPYLIGPVAARMSEIDGKKFGGIYSDVVIEWLSGVQLNTLYSSPSGRVGKSLEDLVSIIYSRVQYMMPWGLYAFDAILAEEASSRKIDYDHPIVLLAFLVNEGVPSVDALRLVSVGFERVDAVRLARTYKATGGAQLGVDVVDWIRAQDPAQLRRIIGGSDSRRIDFDFDDLLRSLRPTRLS